MTKQLLEKGDVVIGTVRNTTKVEDLIQKYPVNFDCRILDVTDVAAVQQTVKESFEKHGKIDEVVSNAGYGLIGCAEEVSDDESNHIIATNLTGSIQLIKTSLPYLRKQGGGRIIQLSSYGGQVAYPANSMYHATNFGSVGCCEAVAQEGAQFNIGVTIVEPGGARTEFRYGILWKHTQCGHNICSDGCGRKSGCGIYTNQGKCMLYLFFSVVENG